MGGATRGNEIEFLDVWPDEDTVEIEGAPEERPWLMAVDGDPGVRRLFGHLLRRDGYAVSTYASSVALLNALAEAAVGPCPLLPSTVITDLRPCDGGGLDLIVALRKIDRQLPVLVVSAHEDPTTRRRAAEAGAAGFVAKPFDPLALRDLVRREVHRTLRLRAAEGAALRAITWPWS